MGNLNSANHRWVKAIVHSYHWELIEHPNPNISDSMKGKRVARWDARKKELIFVNSDAHASFMPLRNDQRIDIYFDDKIDGYYISIYIDKSRFLRYRVTPL